MKPGAEGGGTNDQPQGPLSLRLSQEPATGLPTSSGSELTGQGGWLSVPGCPRVADLRMARGGARLPVGEGAGEDGARCLLLPLSAGILGEALTIFLPPRAWSGTGD